MRCQQIYRVSKMPKPKPRPDTNYRWVPRITWHPGAKWVPAVAGHHKPPEAKNPTIVTVADHHTPPEDIK